MKTQPSLDRPISNHSSVRLPTHRSLRQPRTDLGRIPRNYRPPSTTSTDPPWRQPPMPSTPTANPSRCSQTPTTPLCETALQQPSSSRLRSSVFKRLKMNTVIKRTKKLSCKENKRLVCYYCIGLLIYAS
ncbi:unnamed protein product [Vicia faba]|uniref:Uncharacterized protein n=1 Tax=Vicia faba TaxID=3906 RepID=A0AAV0YE90_VICFA|nr:unnamed protein product [Vicia faba]